MEEEFLGALYKGGELLASGKIVEAREHLEKAHGLAPKNEKAQNLLGLAYFKLGLFEQASQVYEKLVNENPTDATLRVNLGLVYLKTNSLERCIKEFETATDLEPTHKKAHNYLGLALAQQGSYVKAKEHFELAGSDQMAEKMARAISAQSAPSGIHNAVAPRAPVNVVIGEESSAPPPPKKAASEEDPIEVMSDEEAPSDAYSVPDEPPPPPPASAPGIGSDWGAQLKQPAPVTTDEMRFAEDEGPVEELPVVEAEVEVVAEAATPTKETPAWLTMEAAEAARVNT
ncbi:MAG TPA: tetratricopeptide repeat protein, partial [Archangium sp.]